MIYTEQEQSTKKYTIKAAIDAASFILSEKGVKGINVTSVTQPQDTRITLVELNKISDRIVAESVTRK